MDLNQIKALIRVIPDFPKQGVMFRDITPLLKNHEAMKYLLSLFEERYRFRGVDKVVGIESRGFIFGPLIARELGVGFVPARKKGKLPAAIESMEFQSEYGKDFIEIHKDAFEPGEHILIVDDVCATGGTLEATANLVKKMGGDIEELACVIDLPALKGRERLKYHNLFYILEF